MVSSKDEKTSLGEFCAAFYKKSNPTQPVALDKKIKKKKKQLPEAATPSPAIGIESESPGNRFPRSNNIRRTKGPCRLIIITRP